MKAKRPIRVLETHAEVPLTQGKVALISLEDVALVSGASWCAIFTTGWYAQARIGYRATLLHRFVSKAPPGVLVDHENRDGLDCRRGNLRLADKSTNGCNRPKQRNNTSGHKGVYWDKKTSRWFAVCTKAGVNHFLGYFTAKEEAADAYKKAAAHLHGAFLCVSER